MELDYVCVVYGSALTSYLRMLDPIQNLALHLCLGAYRTSVSLSCVLELIVGGLGFWLSLMPTANRMHLTCVSSGVFWRISLVWLMVAPEQHATRQLGGASIGVRNE